MSKKWWDSLVLEKKEYEAELKYRKALEGLSKNPSYKMLRQQINRTSEERWRKKMGLDI